MDQAASKKLPLNLLAILMITATATAAEPRNIFILAGQSNMVGKGGVVGRGHGVFVWDGKVPEQCHPDPRIFRLNNESVWEIAREPLHEGIGHQVCGVGPGIPFAKAIIKPRETVGLVPCAQGATYFSQWARGTELYDRILTRARAAVTRGEVLRALLWYQGENDSIYKELADSYKSKLVQFFMDMRNDLQYPSLPIIQVALASGGNYTEIVREAQLYTRLPNLYTVDAFGLEVTKNDPLHLTSSAQVQLGAKLAAAYNNITNL